MNMINKEYKTKYYYPVMDYNGWCIFSSDSLKNIDRWIDYPFITTCPTVADKFVEILRSRKRHDNPPYFERNPR